MIRLHARLPRGALAAAVAVSSALAGQVRAALSPTDGGALISLLDPLEKVEYGCRTYPTVPGEPVYGVAAGEPQRVPGRFGEGLSIVRPGQFVAYPSRGIITPQVGTLEMWCRPGEVKLPAGASSPPRYLFYCGAGKTNSLHCYLEGDRLALVVHAPDGLPRSAKWPVRRRPGWLHVAVTWEPRAAMLYAGGRQVARIDNPALSEGFSGPVYFGNDQWGDKPLVGEIDELAAWAVPRKTFVLGKPLAGVDVGKGSVALPEMRAAAYRRTVVPFLEGLSAQCDEGKFLLAHALVGLGEHAKAREGFWDVISRRGECELKTHAEFGVAEAFAVEGAHESAMSVLTKLAEAKNVGTAAYAEYWIGKVYLMMKHYSAAFRQCEKLIAGYPENVWANYAYYSSGTGHFQLKDYERALGAFQLVGTAGSARMRVAELGRPIRIRVADADLLARAESRRFAVTVTATSGDTERLAMDPAESRGVYIGRLQPQLGAAVPGDGTLQVLGNDRVTIAYEDQTMPHGQKTLSVTEDLPVVANGSIDILKDIYPARMAEVAQLADDGYLAAETMLVLKPLPPKASAEILSLVADNQETLDVAALRRALHRPTLKPGQAFYVEVRDGDGDVSDGPDTVSVKIATSAGKSQAFDLEETGAHTGVFGAEIPTCSAEKGLADGRVLPVSIQDTVSAHYEDAENTDPGKPAPRSDSIDVRYADAVVTVRKMVPEIEASVPVVRFLPGDILEVRVEDKDRDLTADANELQIVVSSTGGDKETATLYETLDKSGVFLGTVRTREGEGNAGDGIIQMMGGDQITVSYQDRENTESAGSVAREVKANALSATTAVVKIVDEQGDPVDTLSPGDILRVLVSDADVIQTGRETAKVKVISSGGHSVELALAVPEDGATSGVFRESGLLRVTLGDTNSPETVTLGEDGRGTSGARQLPVQVVNVMGNDSITVVYADALGRDGLKNADRTCSVGIASKATIVLGRSPTGAAVERIKPGDMLLLRVADPDRDITPGRDSVDIVLESGCGDTLALCASETLSHSGVFEATFRAVVGEANPTDDTFTIALGDDVKISYVDARSPGNVGPESLVHTISVIPGSDGEVAVFSKSFLEDQLAADTFVKLAESYYRVAARRLMTEETPPGEIDELGKALELSERVIRRWPGGEHAVAAQMILGNVLCSLGEYQKAVTAYEEVASSATRRNRARAAMAGLGMSEGEADDPEEKMDGMAAYALYRIGVAYFDDGKADEASRAWARLIFRYPDSKLVPKAVLRKGEAYYKAKDFLRAAKVFEKFVEYHPRHSLADKVMYKSGICYYLTKNYRKAGDVYSRMLLDHPHSAYAGDAQYWLGESLYHSGQRRSAFVEFQRLLTDFPKCQWRQQAQLRVIELE